ncbi:MAG: serine hydrolase [Bacteroidota bacterium]
MIHCVVFIYNRILQEETQRTILTDIPLPNGEKVGYGMGWGISTDAKGRDFISHTGGNAGSVCRLIVYPEQKLSIAVVSNTFGIDYLRFIRELSKISNSILEEIGR